MGRLAWKAVLEGVVLIAAFVAVSAFIGWAVGIGWDFIYPR